MVKFFIAENQCVTTDVATKIPRKLVLRIFVVTLQCKERTRGNNLTDLSDH